ncbi:MAG: hypothetical protein ACREQ8_10725, partial [Woeseiaceae bacterium]
VQDFGGPDDSDAPMLAAPRAAEPPAPASATLQKRPRGRPPGSRTKKKAEAEGAELGQHETAV